MADQLKINQSLTFTQETPPETFRLIDVNEIKITQAYSHGKTTIPANTTDKSVADNVNIFMVYADKPCTLKVGNTTNPAMTGVTVFSYVGSKTSFFVSNATTEDVVLSIVTGSLP